MTRMETEKRPLYLKKCIRTIINDNGVFNEKQSSMLSLKVADRTIMYRVLGYVVNVLEYNKVQIDDGTGILDVELLQVEKNKNTTENDVGDTGKDNNNTGNTKKRQQQNINSTPHTKNTKRLRYTSNTNPNPPSENGKHSKIVQLSRVEESFVVDEYTELPQLFKLIEVVGTYNQELKCLKCNSYCIVTDPNYESLRHFEIANATNSLHNADIKNKNVDNMIEIDNDGNLIFPNSIVKKQYLQASSEIDELLAGLSSNDFMDMSQG
eukprot:g5785.t1